MSIQFGSNIGPDHCKYKLHLPEVSLNKKGLQMGHPKRMSCEQNGLIQRVQIFYISMFKGVFCIGLIWIWRVLCYTYHLLPKQKNNIFVYILDSSTQFYTDPHPTLSWKRVCGHPKNCPTVIRSATKTRSDKLPCAMATAVFEGLVFLKKQRRKKSELTGVFFRKCKKGWSFFWNRR